MKNMYQARGKVMDHLLSRAFDQVRVQGVLDQIWERVSDQVVDQVRDHVSDQVWHQVRNQVSDQVWHQVRNQARDQVSDSLRKTQELP